MKLPEMKTGLTISAMIHAALLLWGIISFAARPLEAKPNDALPVDIISDKQFSEITKGVKNAPKDKPPAPLVEKVGDPKPVDDSTAKVTEKKELVAAKTDALRRRPPRSRRRSREAKPEKKEPPKVDPIAETLKKEEARRKRKTRPRRKPAQQAPKPQPQFDPTKIAALLDKREPTRQAAAGETLSPMPVARKVERHAQRTLSQSEIDALRKRLGECWNPPAGAMNGGQLKVVLRVVFKPDATVATAAAAGRGHALSIRAGDGGKRQARDPDLPAVHDAAGRSLPAVERHRDHLRSARNVRRLTKTDSRTSHDARSARTRLHRRGQVGLVVTPVAAGGRRPARCRRGLWPAPSSCRRGRQHRRDPGQHPADPDCASGFRRRRLERQRRRAQRHPGDHRQSEALRPVRADRSRRLHREGLEHRRAAALCRLADHQRAGARHRPHHPPGRRAAEVGIPAVGRGRRTSSSPARSISPRPTSGAVSRISFPTRSTSA